MTSRFVTALAASLVALAALGCAAPTTAEHQASAWPPARFIVKPRSPMASEADAVALVRAHLLRPERVRLFRAMSGGAYVFEVVAPGARDDLPSIVRALDASRAFDYVEIDAPVTIR